MNPKQVRRKQVSEWEASRNLGERKLAVGSAFRTGLVPLFVVACLPFFTHCNREPKPLATWDGGAASQQDYESWLRYTDVLDRPEAVKEMILVEYLVQAAKARGLDQEPAVKMEMGKTRHQVFWGQMRAHVFTSVTVEDAEVKALREQNPRAFHKPLKMRLRNIFLKSSEDPEEAAKARERLADIRVKLLAGADFETLARQESQSQTRFSGGKLGVQDIDKMPAGVAASIKDLKVGDISQVVETGFGFSIFLCEDIQAPVIPTAEEVEAKIRTNLTRIRAKEKWQQTLQAMRNEIKLPESLVPVEGFLDLPGYRMSEADLNALVAMQMKGLRASQVPKVPLQALLTNWCVGVQMEKKGLAMGFDRIQKAADELRWKPAQVLARYELASRVTPRVEKPTAEEVETYFKERPDHYQTLPAFQLAVIHFGPEGNDGATIRQAEAVSRKIDGGELTFAQAAKRFSTHPSAKNGGQLGWLSIQSLASWGPKLVQAIRQMQPGERTGVFRLESGIWIFELHNVREAVPMTFEQARRKVEVDCYNHRAKAMEEVVRKEILEGLSVQINAKPVS